MALSLQHGRRITLSKVDAFADGVAVKQVSPRSVIRLSFKTLTAYLRSDV